MSLEPQPPLTQQQQQLNSTKTSSAGCGTTIGTVAESDMDESDWFDSCTNHHVIASSYQSMVEGDPWNHPLLNDDDDDYFLEASKRVSLDATETWMTTTDDHDAATASDDLWLDPNLMLSPTTGMIGGGPVMFSFALPSSISFPTDDDDDHHGTGGDDDNHHEDSMNLLQFLTTTTSASLDDSSNSSETESWHSQFQQRRVQLAKSMAASQSTRSLLSQHVQTRASLQQVLLEIEKSTTQIRQHIVIESVGMAVEDSARVGSDDLASPITTTTITTTTSALTPAEKVAKEKLDSTTAAATRTQVSAKDEGDDDVEMEDVADAAPSSSSLANSNVTPQDELKPAAPTTLVQA